MSNVLERAFVYLANGVGNVLGYMIDPSTGALTAVAGSPFPAGSAVSVAVDPSGTFVYVPNGESGVSGYTIEPSTGALTVMANSPFTAGLGPLSVTITPMIPFASSIAKLEITAGTPSSFDLKESFALGTNSHGINPVTEKVTC